MKLFLSAVVLAGIVGVGCESGPAVQRIELSKSSSYLQQSPQQQRPAASPQRSANTPSHIPADYWNAPPQLTQKPAPKPAPAPKPDAVAATKPAKPAKPVKQAKSEPVFTPLPGESSTSGETAKPATDKQAIVTPADVITGKVVTYNDAGRFIVANFPVDHMPEMDRVMNIQREGKKVGEVKITGPQQGQNIIASLVSGEAQTGDEVRDH